jgi:dihydrofolate reductase
VSSVIFDMSMSLDGYVRAANPRPDEPWGEGGEALHAWAMDDDAAGRDVLERGVAGTGAVICGRATYDDSLPWWDADGPTGPARLPVFVLTHTAHIELEPTDHESTSSAAHLRYRIKRASSSGTPPT